MEKIIKIEQSEFFKDENNESNWYSFDGFVITTNIQTIKIGISNFQSCCENFGCIITNDNIEEFIDSELKDIYIVDNSLNNKKIEELEYLDCGGVMFVNFETSEGLLQFVAYNAHNGYYGHEAVLISKQLNCSEYL